ncbi:hypothetical protein [Undibacterium sp. YM2]|uniref:hypothetical protein n=1 Tax=Undibacterium sp. YM2 TaxID=2058625 RepID=UPI00138A6CAD|nr:hypothetical protein [Undibacterium sp. YM2]
MTARLLTEMVPGLDAMYKPVDLVQRPTPISHEASLAARWKLQELWVKRDDLSSPSMAAARSGTSNISLVMQ